MAFEYDNVSVDVKGDKLTIVIDLKAEGHPSSSGKNTTIGTTGGNVMIPGTNGVKLGVNAFRTK